MLNFSIILLLFTDLFEFLLDGGTRFGHLLLTEDLLLIYFVLLLRRGWVLGRGLVVGGKEGIAGKSEELAREKFHYAVFNLLY